MLSLQSAKQSSSQPAGFALVIALSLMSFILVLLLSISAFVRVETSNAANQQQFEKAKLNALLGLNIAIGELQKHAGQDSRTTARGEIWDADPSTVDMDAVPNPWLTGIWNVGKDFWTSGEVQLPAYLISGNEGKGFDMATATTYPAGYIRPNVAMDAALSTVPLFQNARIPNQEIVAPVISIDSTNQGTGRYAYWVGDEGVKVKLNHPEGDTVMTDLDNGSDASNYLLAKLPGSSALTGLGVLAPSSDALKASLRMNSGAELSLVESSLSVDDYHDLYHDVTFDTRGVLAKTTADYATDTGAVVGLGGLKQDLTTGLLAGGLTSAELAEPIYEPMIGTAVSADGNHGGPPWSQIKSYMEITPSNAAFDETASYQVRPATSDQMGIYPVLTFGQLHVNIRVVQHGVDDYRVWYYFRPTFVLWNPYNAQLDAEDYYVGIRLTKSYSNSLNRLRWDYEITTSDSSTHTAPGGSIDLPVLGYNVMPFKLSAGRAMQPGEAIVFTAPDDAAVAFNNADGYSVAGDSIISVTTTAATGLELTPGFREGAAYAYEVPGSSFSIPEGETVVSIAAGASSGAGTSGAIGGEIPFALTLEGVEAENLNDGDVLQYITRLPFYTFGSNSLNSGYSLAVHTTAGEFTINSGGDSISFYTEPISMEVAHGLDPVDLGNNDLFLEDIPANFALTLSMRYGENALRSAEPASVQDSLLSPWLAHYNPRAPVSGRSPFEYDNSSSGGSNDNPSFHTEFFMTSELGSDLGAYSRLGFIAENGLVGFSDASGEGTTASALFNLPRRQSDVRSIGDLMHVNFWFADDLSDASNNYALSNYTPAYAVGNSLADPRLDLDAVERDAFPGFTFDTNRRKEHVYRDFSYHLNRALWDGYFFSTLPVVGHSVVPPSPFVLENSRIQKLGDPSVAELSDDERAASHLMLDGAFNINSTSVEAWKALLASFYGVQVNSLDGASYTDLASSPYVRAAYPLTSALDESVPGNTPTAFSGFRSLSSDEIDLLAHAIVKQVKIRGPFASLGDFVNRAPRPVSLQGETISIADAKPWQLSGALQAAIDESGINDAFYGVATNGNRLSIDDSEVLDVYKDNISGVFYYREFNRDAMAISLAANAPGFLSQADLLAKLGGVIQARSDTFKIRCYGDVKDEVTGNVLSQVWGEALVQRIPKKVDGSDVVLGDALTGVDFGRQFVVLNFRWLSENEI